MGQEHGGIGEKEDFVINAGLDWEPAKVEVAGMCLSPESGLFCCPAHNFTFLAHSHHSHSV